MQGPGSDGSPLLAPRSVVSMWPHLSPTYSCCELCLPQAPLWEDGPLPPPSHPLPQARSGCPWCPRTAAPGNWMWKPWEGRIRSPSKPQTLWKPVHLLSSRILRWRMGSPRPLHRHGQEGQQPSPSERPGVTRPSHSWLVQTRTRVHKVFEDQDTQLRTRQGVDRKQSSHRELLTSWEAT